MRNHYDAFTRGDLSAALDAMDEGIEFSVAEHSIFYRGETIVGRQQVVERIFRRLGTEWEGFVIKPEAFHDAGDVVIMQGRYGGTYKATRRSTNAQVLHVWTIRNGKLTKFQQYVDTAEMRAVAGMPATVVAEIAA